MKIEIYWLAITVLIAVVMYVSDEGTRYQVIGVLLLFAYSLGLNLFFLLGRCVYMKFFLKKKP